MYRGQMYHTGQWPAEGLDVSGKRVAIIGQGATGVQVVQELAKQAGQLTVFLRTPNTAIPMRQRQISEVEQDHLKGSYATIFKGARDTFGGFAYAARPEPDSTAIPLAEREEYFEEMYRRGGFNYVSSVWMDFLFNPTANRVMYDFWAKKTRARMTDPAKRDLLAPLEPQHPFMTKRPSLEQDYYECMDRENVSINDMRSNDIKEFTEKGIITADGKEQEFDVVVLATGFDNYTGSFHTMGLKDKNGQDLGKKWKEGVRTYGGLTVHGHPNMWMVYGPQGKLPTNSVNTPGH
jgi:cation diffusion facilitator CzcD-associated flavoprotein CzcO